MWDAARGITEKGAGTLIVKVDIQHACRKVPVHPTDWTLLGMIWEGGLFIDTALPFGLQSPNFNAVVDAVEWILRNQGVKFVIHYLDD